MSADANTRQDTQGSRKRRRSCYEEGTKSPSLPDTNSAKRSAYDTGPTQDGLEKERQNMMWDLDEKVSEIERVFFEEHLLPPSRLSEKEGIKAVVDRLRDAGEIDERGFWARWPQPSASSEHEDTIFKEFESLVKAIAEAAEIPGGTTINIKCNSALLLDSYTRKNTIESKPDCYGILKDAKLEVDSDTRKPQPRWLDVATPGELSKKHAADHFVNNATKVLWSMNHIMREDPRRCFVIGFTIEDSSMRYWYCSRSDIFVSEPFNMLTDHEILADFVLRMSFATKSQLGWDSSITLHSANSPGDAQYDIVVHDKNKKTSRTFRTQKILSSLGAEALRGRGTRVWEVKELNAEKEEVGEPCVLKDSWIDDDRQCEGDILAEIRKATAERGPDDSNSRRVDRSLLTVITYGDVCCDKRLDRTRIRKDAPPHTDIKVINGGPKASNHVSPSMSAVAAPVVEKNEKKEVAQPYPTKLRHRTVFKEVCTTIREVTSLREAFYYLRRTVLVLGCLHITFGWVHRDISSGNILIYDGDIKLADLEYAQHESKWNIHGTRTGTPYFMAVEVDGGTHHHRTAPQLSVPKVSTTAATPAQDNWSALLDESLPLPGAASSNSGEPSDTGSSPLPPEPVIPFRYNPLHDMESLMWLGFFLPLSARLVSIGQTPVADLDRYTVNHRDLADKLFTDKESRTKIMLSFQHLENCLSQADLHPRVKEVVDDLQKIHAALQAAYVDTEKGMLTPIPFNIAATHNLYKIFVENLKTLTHGKDDIIVTADQNSCDELRKKMCLEAARRVDDNTKPKASRDNDNDTAMLSGRPLKKQRTSDDRDGTAALANRTSRLNVGSRAGRALSRLSNTGVSSSAPTESTL